ncbi:MAG: hypothetical protein CV089_08885 [Nitrospira sp. WS110]|nr:hypothetical protein [Nitrospira sp. WS110]
MIINGGARKSGGFFARHLMKAEENERVEIKEMRGLYAEDLPEAFREMRMLAAGTRAENYFYHANVNPMEDEQLTPEQWEQTADTLERNLGLENHPRVIIEHTKNGRTHQHIVWSRVDMDTGTVTPATDNYYIHAQTARELEQAFSLAPVQLPLPPERDRVKDWESFRGQESGIDPKEMKAEITALWHQSDSGGAFQAAIEEKGYLLAKGDRRDFVLIDPAGDVHSLARRIDGAKAADIRAKMVDLDRDSLLSAKEASAWMKGKEEAENSGSSDARILPEEERQEREPPSEVSGGIVNPVPPASPLSPKLAILEKYATDHPPEPMEYVRVTSAKDVSDFYKALYASTDWHDLQPSAASRHAAWEGEQARVAEASREHDPPAGEPPVEPVSFERATRGIDPPQTFHEREPVKRDTETWAEFVTRTKPPDRTEEIDKSDHTEPELER